MNPPLTFELKNLDHEHPYLEERGLAKENIKEVGIGFCSRSLMKGRIAITIYSENGELVAYAGRYPGEANPSINYRQVPEALCAL